jgi:DNA primase
MIIPQNKIDEIASTVDIVEIISAYTPLKKSGKNFMGRCPFHEERTPSFSVSQEKGLYHCFGCGKSGNVFTFISETENVSFIEAVKILAERCNIQIEFKSGNYKYNNSDTIFKINQKAAIYYHKNLLSKNGAFAYEYLKTRNIKDETIKKFGLGYSLRERDGLFKELIKEFSAEDIKNAGLIVELTSKDYSDRFRGRLMFPIFNEAGKLCAFAARKLYDDSKDEPKYINSPETAVYFKSKILYGLNLSKNNIKQKGFVLIVEGYLDLISLFQNKIENVVAVSGTSFTKMHANIIKRYTNEAVLVFDADLAGYNAAKRTIQILFENDLSVSVLELPKGNDPDSFINKFGYQKFESLINNRLSVTDYIASQYKEKGLLNTPEGKTELIKELITLISKINDNIKRDFYIKDISEKFHIYESIIRKELVSALKSKSKLNEERININNKINNQNTVKTNYSLTDLLLIKFLIEGDIDTKDFLINKIEQEMIENEYVKKIINYLIIKIINSEIISNSDLYNKFNDDISKDILGRALVDDIYVIQVKNKFDYYSEANKLIQQLKLNIIKREIKKIEESLKQHKTVTEKTKQLLLKQKQLILKQHEYENKLNKNTENKY